MRILAGMSVALLLSIGAAQAAIADDQADNSSVLAVIDDATFDAQFQCPESLTSDDGKIDEIEGYLVWSRLRHPDWSFRKRLDVRFGLLRRHACDVTLRNVASSALPAFAP